MGRLVYCQHCHYVWEYSGSHERATCPSCSGKAIVDPDSAQNRLEAIASEYGLTTHQSCELMERVRHYEL